MKNALTALQLRWLNRAVWMALVVGLAHTLWRLPSLIQTQTGDFVAYYGSALAVARGIPLGGLYNDAMFWEVLTGLGIAKRSIFFPNPPSIPVLFLPFTFLSLENAFLLWTVMNYAVAVAVATLFVRAAQLRGVYRILFIAVALNFQPTRSTISHGQIYIVLSALLLWVWWRYKRERVTGFGSALGLLLITKVFAVHVWLLTLGMPLRSAWRAWLAGAATVALVIALSAVITGLPAWQTWFTELVGRTSSELMQHTTSVRSIISPAYQSVHGTLGHFMIYDEKWNPDPMLHASELVKPLSAAIALGLTMLGTWMVRQRSVVQGAHADAVFASLASLSIVLFPYALDYMYAAAIIPIGLWVRWLQAGQSVKLHIGVLIGIVLVAASYPAKSLVFAQGFLSVFAHLKVYGLLLLIGLTAWQVYCTRPVPDEALAQVVQPN